MKKVTMQKNIDSDLTYIKGRDLTKTEICHLLYALDGYGLEPIAVAIRPIIGG